MEELFKDDEFAQYILNKYYAEKSMTDEEKLELASSSIEEFNMALDCFRLSSGKINKH